MKERGIFKTELIDIELQICMFHLLRTFSREVTIDKLGITSGQRKTILAKLQDITYARTEEGNDAKYPGFLYMSPNHLVTYYFNNSLHNIKSEWVEELKTRKLNFSESINNRLESFFLKLKCCMTARISIVQVFYIIEVNRLCQHIATNN